MHVSTHLHKHQMRERERIVGGTVDTGGNVLEVVEGGPLTLRVSTANHHDQQVSTPLTPSPIPAAR
jgi:hypothetical protein